MKMYGGTTVKIMTFIIQYFVSRNFNNIFFCTFSLQLCYTKNVMCILITRLYADSSLVWADNYERNGGKSLNIYVMEEFFWTVLLEIS